MKKAGILLLVSLAVALWPVADAAAQPGRTTPEEAKLKGDPNAARPYWHKGAEAYKAAKYNDAVKNFEKAFELYEHWTFQYCIGQAYRKAGNYKRAFQAYERYTKICPKPDPIVWLRIGDCQIKGGGRDWIEPKHKESYQKYLQLEPNGPYAEQARTAIKTGIAISDQDKRSPETLKQAHALFEKGHKLFGDLKYAEAGKLYMEGWEKFKMSEMLLNAAVCYGSAGYGRGDEAKLPMFKRKRIEILEQYLKTPGAKEYVWHSLALTYISLGDYPKARDTYERYVKLHPNGSLAYLANEYLRLYRGPKNKQPTPEQLKQSKEAIARAEKHYKAGRYGPALKEFQTAEKAVPLRSTAYNIGMCFMRLKRESMALARFEALLKERSTAADGHIRLRAAECCLKMNRFDDAAKHVQQFEYKSDPYAPNAQANIAWARQLKADIKKAKKKGSSSRRIRAHDEGLALGMAPAGPTMRRRYL